jgi:hypothetical protein
VSGVGGSGVSCQVCGQDPGLLEQCW